MLNHIVTKPVRKHLPRQRRDRHPRALPLQYIPEILKVGIPPAYGAVLELEGGNVGPADDLVVCVHAARRAVRLGVFDLEEEGGTVSDVGMWESIEGGRGIGETHFDFKEVFWWAVDLFETLLAGVWHCLHLCGLEWWGVSDAPLLMLGYRRRRTTVSIVFDVSTIA